MIGALCTAAARADYLRKFRNVFGGFALPDVLRIFNALQSRQSCHCDGTRLLKVDRFRSVAYFLYWNGDILGAKSRPSLFHSRSRRDRRF